MNEKIKCPKCDGKKKLSWAAHVADGDCFTCNATGFVLVSELNIKPASEHELKCVDFILNCDDSMINKLTFRQISKMRSFAHSGNGRQILFPTMRTVYFERFENRFQQLQIEKLEQHYENNPV